MDLAVNIIMIHKSCLRAMLRQCSRLNFADNPTVCGIYLQDMPNPRVEYQQSYSADLIVEDTKVIKKLLPSPISEYVARNITSRHLSPTSLKQLVLSAYNHFKKDPNSLNLSYSALVDLELACVKLINEQARISKGCSFTLHKNISVVVSAVYFNPESYPRTVTPPYSFFYRVTLENRSSDSWLLSGRHWLFECEAGKVEVPKYSSGVVGQTPIILPGKSFTYMSMTFMDSVPGSMKGSFLMINQDTGEILELPAGPVNLNPELFVT